MKTRAKKVVISEFNKPLKPAGSKVTKKGKQREYLQKKIVNNLNKADLSSDSSSSEIGQQFSGINQLDKLFLVKHPRELLSFWSWAKQLNPNFPRDAFKQLCSLELVGPFENLDNCRLDGSDGSENRAVVTTGRTATDLPEMQTILTYDKGRFCYWRDTPSDSEPYLIHVPNQPEHFPELELVGDSNPFCALYHLMFSKGLNINGYKHLLPDHYQHNHYNQEFVKQLRKKRAKEAIGKPFHAMGIKVQVKADVGYRPVTQNYKRLQQDIETMGTTTNEDTRAALRKSILEIFSYVQFANDELDFGMGLEFGHQLYLSNYACFDGLAKSVLCNAYNLLNRSQFTDILQAQYNKGRRSTQ
uniref:Histone PARylation factor 1 n=1 Tax=Ditylenchus dipsaci TaxID=166011 RepID=A0A915E373_9BILA